MLDLCCDDRSTISAESQKFMISLIEQKLVDLVGCMKQLMLRISAIKYVTMGGSNNLVIVPVF